MPYGTIKVDTITFTDAGVDKSVAISGLVQNPTFTGNVTATGTISGLIVQAPTVTGTTANFASGVYTTQISGAIVKVPAGSAGAPSIQVGVGASVAPGLYGAGTDLLGISTGGAGRIFIDSTGQLGVGTSSPTARLDLGAPGNVNFFQASNGVNSTLRFTFASNLTTIGNAGGTAGLALETNGSERLRIDSAGNVGIGTSSPQEKLHIEGAGRQSLRINNTTPGSAVSPELTTIDFYGWSSQPKARIEAQDQAINFNGGWLALSTANTSNVLTRALTIDNSQRVGIGTSSPTTLLHVNQPGVTGGEYGVRVSQISATANALKLTIDSTNTLSGLMQESTVPLVFGTNNTERLRIDSSGRLLIGTNTSTTQSGVAGLLQVEATSGNEAAIKVKNNQNTSTAAYVALSKSRGTTVNSNTIVQDGDNIGSVIWFAADGIDTAGYCAEITAAIDGTPGIDNVPGRLVFSTAANGNATASERMRIDSSGNVGIGTSSPGNALHVIGSIQVGSTSDTIYSSNFGNYSSSSDLSLISGSANLLFKTGAANTERARIDTSGNLGIGTNTPTAKLESYFSSTNPSLSSNTGAGLSVYGTSTVRLNFGNYPASPYSSWVQSSDGLGNAWPIALNPLGGNVGIGTSSPGAQLHVFGSSEGLRVETSASSEGYIRFVNTSGSMSIGMGGAVGNNLLIYDRTNGQSAYLYTGGAAGSHIWSTNNIERARIDSSGRLLVGTSTYDGNARAVIQGNTSDGLAGAVDIQRGDASPASGSLIGTIRFRDTTAGALYASIECGADAGTAAADKPGRLVFSTTADGASSPTERMRIGNDGQLSIGVNSVGAFARASLLASTTSGSHYGVHVNSTNTTNGAVLVEFTAVTTEVGNITTNGTSSVSYNTTSDYRLKENIAPVLDGIARLQQLKPSRFNFIADPDKTVDGFLAHEAQAVVPECVTGEKDAVDADGNPVYQGIDQSKLVPLLTAALQEAIAKIETLEAKVAALEGN
jgi:hypothetical protein